MTDNDLHAEVERLRHQVAGLTETVAALTMLVTGQRPNVFPYDEMNAYLNDLSSEEHAFLHGLPPGPDRADLEGGAARGLTPPRSPADVLPRSGRNPRIGCDQYESGTWIHGRPHDCPRWARR